jgi:hypothetical protein
MYKSFTVATMTWLTVLEYLEEEQTTKWPKETKRKSTKGPTSIYKTYT